MPDCHICGESIDNPSRCDCASEMMKLCMERDEYREALESIRDRWTELDHVQHSNAAYIIAEVALDPKGCADLARIPKP